MAEFLLIHGAGHGAWAWEEVIPALTALGHSARAIDLPGRGGGATTLAAQAGAIVAALRGPTVLVGHSAGGFAITAAALASAQVTGLIYVCAFIPQPGCSIAGLRRACPEIGLRGSYRISADRQSFAFDAEKAKHLFFHDCPDPAAAAARMCAEPVAPQETALERLPDLPRAVVFCSEDRAIPLAYQQKMAEGIAVRRELPSGHSPFLSMPGALATVLDALSGR